MPRQGTIQVRLPDDIRKALAAFETNAGLNTSAAVRILLRNALGTDIRTAAVREGVEAGIQAVKKRLREAADSAFSDLGGS